MLYQLPVILLMTCMPIPQANHKPLRGEEMVRLIAEPKFYVTGAFGDGEMEFFQEPDPKRMWWVSGIILEIIAPPEHAGRIIGMHHDGVLPSGNPYSLWQVGGRYEFRFPKENIGKLDFRPCSIGGTRTVLLEVMPSPQQLPRRDGPELLPPPTRKDR